METLREIADRIDRNKTKPCTCDLDNWEPTRATGHSWVCWIHKQAHEEFRNQPRRPTPTPEATDGQ